MSTSQIFAAIDAIVTIAQTQFAGLPVDVFDGPINVQVPEHDFLLVGCDDPHNQGAPIVAVDGDSEWVGLGALHRDETFTVYCTYVAWSNDPTMTLARARAHTNIGLIETELRNKTTNGITLYGALNQPGWAGLKITGVSQVNTGNGIQVHVLFGVVCRGRI